MSIKKRILFFDTETTGFVKDKAHKGTPSNNEPNIVQLAGEYGVYEFDDSGKLIGSEQIITFDRLFKSIMPIPEVCTKIHGITDEMVRDRPHCFGAVEFNTFLMRTKECDIICGHNVTYDMDMTLLETRRMYPTYDFMKWFVDCTFKLRDTMKHGTNVCKIPQGRGGFKRPKLHELHHFLFNEGFDDAHNAMADITATKRCFFDLVEKHALPLHK